jgi:hypothetical protein
VITSRPPLARFRGLDLTQAADDDLLAALGALDSGGAYRVRPEDRRDAPTDDERKRFAVADELRRRGLPVPPMPLGA